MRSCAWVDERRQSQRVLIAPSERGRERVRVGAGAWGAAGRERAERGRERRRARECAGERRETWERVRVAPFQVRHRAPVACCPFHLLPLSSSTLPLPVAPSQRAERARHRSARRPRQLDLPPPRHTRPRRNAVGRLPGHATRPPSGVLIAQDSFAQRHAWAPTGFAAPFKFSPLQFPFAAPSSSRFADSQQLLRRRAEDVSLRWRAGRDSSICPAPPHGAAPAKAPAGSRRRTDGPRCSIGQRPEHRAAFPVHVTLRARRHIPSLRLERTFAPVSTAISTFVARGLSRAALLRTKRSRAPDRGS